MVAKAAMPAVFVQPRTPFAAHYVQVRIASRRADAEPQWHHWRKTHSVGGDDMTTSPPELGSPDPERKTSPVAWEADEDTETLRAAVPDEALCFFNDRPYGDGTIGRSGNTLLRCDRGVWVPAGPAGGTKP
jgi:hypothetical protein